MNLISKEQMKINRKVATDRMNVIRFKATEKDVKEISTGARKVASLAHSKANDPYFDFPGALKLSFDELSEVYQVPKLTDLAIEWKAESLKKYHDALSDIPNTKEHKGDRDTLTARIKEVDKLSIDDKDFREVLAKKAKTERHTVQNRDVVFEFYHKPKTKKTEISVAFVVQFWFDGIDGNRPRSGNRWVMKIREILWTD